MPNYLALLRGINVSGKNIIKMDDLRSRLEAAGYTNIKTYIQSGNVLFVSPVKSKQKLAGAFEKFITEQYGYTISVFVLDAGDVEKAVASMPFSDGREPEGPGSKKLYVTFLSDVPSDENMEKLRQAPIGEDKIEVIDNVLYFKLESRASESKLSNNLIETKLKLRATTRNWNVTLKLLELLEGHAK